MQNKTADDVQIGDVVIYEVYDRTRITLHVTSVYEDRHGCILIDGDNFASDMNRNLFGLLASHIVKYVSHAEPPKENCCKGIGFHTSGCTLKDGIWYEPNTRTIYHNSTDIPFITLGKDISKIIKEN